VAGAICVWSLRPIRFPAALQTPLKSSVDVIACLPIAPASKPARFSVIPVSDDDRTAVNAILKQDYGGLHLDGFFVQIVLLFFGGAEIKDRTLFWDGMGRDRHRLYD
jgi:hypothetical protein